MTTLLLSAACAALVPFPIVRESQLPLSGKRVLVAAPRAVAAPLAAALINVGARPLWSQCVITEPLDEESLGELDDALLRLTEYDLLLLLSRDAVDAVVQRGLLLSDSSEDALRLMLRASDVEIAALGPAALHLSAALSLAADAVPVDATPDGLASVLSALGTVRAVPLTSTRTLALAVTPTLPLNLTLTATQTLTLTRTRTPTLTLTLALALTLTLPLGLAGARADGPDGRAAVRGARRARVHRAAARGRLRARAGRGVPPARGGGRPERCGAAAGVRPAAYPGGRRRPSPSPSPWP